MAQPPLTRQVQDDFSGGMFRSGRRDAIPPNGLYDASNGLIERTDVYKRGGTAYLTTAFGQGLRFIWDGWLANGQTTLVASTTAFGKREGGAITNLGGPGMTRAGRPAVYAGVIYLPGGFTYDGTTFGEAVHAEMKATYYAVVANRLLSAGGSRVLFSKIGKPLEHTATNFHELPGGVEILGLEGLRSSAAVFTTAGIWIIGGLTHQDLTDEAGNMLQTLDLYSNEMILWGSGGIASWEGSLVVPGTDGIYLLSLGVTSERAQSFVRLSDPIVDLYQGYVRDGYLPGQATVFRNHYMLPIIGGGDVIDLLVCRLDTPSRPWTHLEGPGAKVAALTTRVVTGTSRTPELLGALYSATNSRPLTLFYLEPNANYETDHDGSLINFNLTTRSFTTGSLVPNFVERLRVRYQLAGSQTPTVEARVLSESPQPPGTASVWGAFAWGVGKWSTPSEQSFEPLDGTAPVSLDAMTPKSWYPRRKRRFVAFRLACRAKTSQLVIRSLELFVRPTGKL